ncbi:MAG: Pterin-4-alpha-carbinolamine dehydratase, partial [uncultured Thermomicrobiales bacterium]
GAGAGRRALRCLPAGIAAGDGRGDGRVPAGHARLAPRRGGRRAASRARLSGPRLCRWSGPYRAPRRPRGGRRAPPGDPPRMGSRHGLVVDPRDRGAAPQRPDLGGQDRPPRRRPRLLAGRGRPRLPRDRRM